MSLIFVPVGSFYHADTVDFCSPSVVFVLTLDYHADTVTKSSSGRGPYKMRSRRERGDDAILERSTRHVCAS